MDSRLNPFAPGAGTPPPELAGRDPILERAAVALDRIRLGRAARSLVLYGLRGVGKTVLLNAVRLDAEARGLASVRIEAPEERSLPSLLVPALRVALIRLSRKQAARASVERAMRALAGFARALRVAYGDLAVGIEVQPEPGLADSGDLDSDLSELLKVAADAAEASGTALVLYLDELQYLAEPELAALIVALHDASQEQRPVTMLAAGLPQVLAQAGRAKSYAERLFEFVNLDRLSDSAAKEALCVPVERQGVVFADDAVQFVIKQTQGYPYFLQELGKHSWDVAGESPIERKDVQRATLEALAELDASFFRVRFDRLTRTERLYLRAMAELGPGPHRSGAIAARLGRKVTSVAPVRNALIAKGMLYSPGHGDTAFTVPLFDGFMKRIMPELG